MRGYIPPNTPHTFKNIGEKIYKAGQPDFELEPKELEELQVAYRFYVEYYI